MKNDLLKPQYLKWARYLPHGEAQMYFERKTENGPEDATIRVSFATHLSSTYWRENMRCLRLYVSDSVHGVDPNEEVFSIFGPLSETLEVCPGLANTRWRWRDGCWEYLELSSGEYAWRVLDGQRAGMPWVADLGERFQVTETYRCQWRREEGCKWPKDADEDKK